MLSRGQIRWALLSAMVIAVAVGAGPSPAPVLAHNVTVFAWVEGDRVYVETKFSGGRKAKNAPIEVYDSQGNLLLTGRTDAEGAFAFSAPQKSDLTIVLLAGMGHRAEWTVRADEFENTAAAAPAAAAARQVTAGPPQAEKTTGSTAPAANPDSRGLTADQVQAIFEKALDRKLKPLLKHLSESRQAGPSVSDIFGGIGYILGLVGLGAYIQFRRNKK